MNTTKKISQLITFLILIQANISAQTVNPSSSTIEKNKEIDATEFKDLMSGADEATLDLDGYLSLRKKTKVVVLDVRSQLAFDQKHIKGSINIPLTELTEHTLQKILPDKTTHVALACDVSFYGHRSRMMRMTLQAWPVMKAQGYKNVYNLKLDNLLPEQEVELFGE